MKRLFILSLLALSALLLSSCGALPTLPSLDSTVTIFTPGFNEDPAPATATEQVHSQLPTANPAESPSAPPGSPTATLAPPSTAVQPSRTPTRTPTAAFSATPSPSSTPRATSTLKPTATKTAVPYSLQILNPYYLANFTHPDLGCNWLGVAGQVFNLEGLVQKNIIIKAGGTLNGSPVVEQMTMPLAEPDTDLAYGPGGYEITLANKPAASQSAVWVQLYSLDGKPLSQQIFLTTYDDCQKNLLLLNFVEK